MSAYETNLAGIPMRLRAIMAHVGDVEPTGTITTARFADAWCNSNASALNQWLRAGNLPRIPNMYYLSEKIGIPLEWVYFGKVTDVDRHAKRLAAKLDQRIATGEIKEKVKRSASE